MKWLRILPPACAAALMLLSGSLLAEEGQHSCRSETAVFATAEGGCKQISSGLVWGMKALGKYAHGQAVKYCASLWDGGVRDWRLPSKAELRAAILAEAGKYFDFPTNDFFWASDESSAPGAFAALLRSGDEDYFPKDSAQSVVCVRTGANKDYGCSANDPYFTTTQGGCQDRKTRLIWSTRATGWMTWDAAAKYCDRLKVQTWDGWRLPTPEEVRQGGGPNGAAGHVRNLGYEDKLWTMYERTWTQLNTGYTATTLPEPLPHPTVCVRNEK